MIDNGGRPSWAPAHEAPTLLAIQLVTLWQAGMRGLDYLTGPGGPALDAAVDGPVAGLTLYIGVAVTVLGLAARRPGPVIAGHLLLGAWYLGLGGVAFVDRLHPEPITWPGLALGAAGVWLVVRARSGMPTRLAGAAAMLAGQVMLAGGLLGDYRSGTGLAGAGLLHIAIAAGTFTLWQRRDLRAVVEAEVRGE